MHKIPEDSLRHLLVDKGMTDTQAAESLGVSRMSVSRRRKQLGIPQKPKRPEGYYDITEEQDKELRDLYSRGLNDYEVAKTIKFGRNRLREWRAINSIVSKTNKKGLGEKDYEVALNLRKQGKTYKDIARGLGVTRSSVSKFMCKNGHEDYVKYRPKRPSWVDSYELSDIQKQVLVGDLFGDGALYNTSSSTAYYYFSQANHQEFFVRFKSVVMSPLTSNLHSNKDHSASNVSTWSAPCLKKYQQMFYPKGEKYLTKELISLLTPIGLAVWYMGDGSLNRNSPVIHVGNQVDLTSIINELNNKFDISCELKKYRKEQHIRIQGTETFINIINNYVLEEFSYKIPNQFREKTGSYWSDVNIYTIDSKRYKILPDTEKEKVINDLCLYYERKGFPYPRYNKIKRKEDCIRLKNYFEGSDQYPRYGNKTCNHYMPHRFDACRYNNNPMNHWRDKTLFRKFMENRLLYAGSKITDSVIRTGMQLKGVPANFSPSKAKCIYDKYLPAGGSTLDFSSGYGGRLLGFMASSHNSFYVGVEPNTKSYEGLKSIRDECCEFFEEVAPDSINFIHAPFEDVSDSFKDNSFDLVFSSPPYFGLEIYSDEETQSFSRYPEYSSWLYNFWFFIIKESFRVLKPGGVLVYTIGNYEDYTLVEDTLKYIECTKFEPLEFDSLSYKNVFSSTEKKETVFVFKKTA
jgi:predicted transcriptional regulator/SAM-dependent methyltransferase